MNNYKNGYRVWLKIVATVVVCLFTVNATSWSYPEYKISPAKNTLSAQSMFKTLIDAGIKDSQEIKFEIIAGVRLLLAHKNINTVNLMLAETYGYTTEDKRKVNFLSVEEKNSGAGKIKAKFEVEGHDETFEIEYTDTKSENTSYQFKDEDIIFQNNDNVVVDATKFLESSKMTIDELSEILSARKLKAYNLSRSTNRSTNRLFVKKKYEFVYEWKKRLKNVNGKIKTFLLVRNNEIAGAVCFEKNPAPYSSALMVDQNKCPRNGGSTLMDAFIKYLKQKDVSEIGWESHPKAIGFYDKYLTRRKVKYIKNGLIFHAIQLDDIQLPEETRKSGDDISVKGTELGDVAPIKKITFGNVFQEHDEITIKKIEPKAKNEFRLKNLIEVIDQTRKKRTDLPEQITDKLDEICQKLRDLDQLFDQKRFENVFKLVQYIYRIIDPEEPYTHGHAERVTEYASIIANELIDEPEAKAYENFEETLAIVALLHDIGKIGSNNIANKEKFTDEEYERVKKHTVIGEAILSSFKEFEDIAHEIRAHHERYDGKGYPDGLKGKEIPFIARIIAVADTFDAITSDRPYRKKQERETAKIEIERNSGGQFDPVIVKAFLKAYEKGNLKVLFEPGMPFIDPSGEAKTKKILNTIKGLLSQSKPIVISISGQAAAGKTVFSKYFINAIKEKLKKELGKNNASVILIRTDDMLLPPYERKTESGRELKQEEKFNQKMLKEVQKALINGNMIYKHIYDNSSRDRLYATVNRINELKITGNEVIYEKERYLIYDAKETEKLIRNGRISKVSKIFIDTTKKREDGNYNLIEKIDPLGHVIVHEGVVANVNEDIANKYAERIFVDIDEPTRITNELIRLFSGKRYAERTESLSKIIDRKNRVNALARELHEKAKKKATVIINNSRPSTLGNMVEKFSNAENSEAFIETTVIASNTINEATWTETDEVTKISHTFNINNLNDMYGDVKKIAYKLSEEYTYINYGGLGQILIFALENAILHGAKENMSEVEIVVEDTGNEINIKMYNNLIEPLPTVIKDKKFDSSSGIIRVPDKERNRKAGNDGSGVPNITGGLKNIYFKHVITNKKPSAGWYETIKDGKQKVQFELKIPSVSSVEEEKILKDENIDEEYLLRKATKQLKGHPVNMYIDTQIIPKVKYQMEDNINTLAHMIARHNSLGLDVKYILDHDKDHEALDLLKEKLQEVASASDLNLIELLASIEGPHKNFDEVINIILEDISSIEEDRFILDRDYLIALEDTSTPNEISIPGYTAGATIGLSLAALRVLWDKVPKKKSNEKDKGSNEWTEYKELRNVMSKKFQYIYERHEINNAEDYSVDELELAVTGNSSTKLLYTLLYVLKPMIRVDLDLIPEYHTITRLLLQSV